MGITIEERIAQLKKLKSFHNGSYGAGINFAMDIVCKYQKILEIIKDWEDGRFSDAVACLRVKAVIEDNEKPTCIDCEYFSDKEYYADNTVTACAVSWGSCTKCQRNITSTSPNREVPSWCPLKGDEDESNSNDN